MDEVARRGEERAKVWITGAGGLIGGELVRAASLDGRNFVARGLSRADADLLDFKTVQELFRKERPGLVIHCAAISRSPASQGAPDLAKRTNVDATANLADLAAEIPFILFSSDLVFDGTKGNYLESDPPNPLSVYAETKVAAEELVRKYPRHCIVRISLTGGHSSQGDRGFNEEMKNAWREGKALNLFVDEFRCPTAAPIVAQAVWELATKRAVGTYHLGGAEKISRYELGKLMASRHPELKPRIIAGSRKEYRGPPRPADTSMDCTKVQEVLSFRLPRFSEWLDQDESGF